MQLKAITNRLDQIAKLQIQKDLHGLQPSYSTSEDEKMQNKVDLQLYLHFEHMLPKQQYHYNNNSQYLNKKVSKQQTINQTINYLTYLNQNIKPLPPQHNQQLLILIQCFNNNNQFITNCYNTRSDNEDQTGPEECYLNFWYMKKRIDFKQFTSFITWNHLVVLSFAWCQWFNDDDWRQLVANSGNFIHLKALYLEDNRITDIKKADIERFKSLQKIRLAYNPLNQQTRNMLISLTKTNQRVVITF